MKIKVYLVENGLILNSYIAIFLESVSYSNNINSIKYYVYSMEKKNKEFSFRQKSIALGVLFGVLVGSVTDQIGIWLPIGIAVGAY